MIYPGLDIPPPRGEISIRLMTMEDLDSVTHIEKEASPSPWNRSLFQGCLGHSYSCYVAEADQKVIGFAISSQVLNEGTIVNLGVDRFYRGYGCGFKLLSAILTNLIDQGSTKVFLEVRLSNSSAIRLYRRLGFLQTGVRKNYYSLGDKREDAILMEKRIE